MLGSRFAHDTVTVAVALVVSSSIAVPLAATAGRIGILWQNHSLFSSYTDNVTRLGQSVKVFLNVSELFTAPGLVPPLARAITDKRITRPAKGLGLQHDGGDKASGVRVWGGNLHEITDLDLVHNHSVTRPRQARRAASFRLSLWRPAPER